MGGSRRALLAALSCFGALAVGACATPASNAGRIAQAAALEQQVLEGEGFRHWAAYRPGPAACRRLHVYLDHDGSPWLGNHTVSTDPSPRDPLALRLMASDPGPALYLGRPCHFVHDGRSACQPLLWTHRRYAEEVVASLVHALATFHSARRFDELVLIGYSGGGTLAMLMAARLPSVLAVATIAANLDTAAWARLHDYSPLLGSLDPATAAPLAASIQQTHFVGGRDENVPPMITRGGLHREAQANVVAFPDFDHRCCWVQAWPELLVHLPPAPAECRRSP